MLLLRNRDVQQVLDMRGTIEALRHGYDDLSRGDATYVPRIDLYAPTGRDDDYYRWGSMAGFCRHYGVVACRIKSDVVSWPAGRTEEKYCVEPGTYSGIILLYASANGEPLSLVQDGILQHMRVGGSAGIGADVLARPDARTLGLLGSGGMARTYLEALMEVRPLTGGRVYSPTPANREAFADAARRDFGIDLEPVGEPRAAVEGMDIVATATDAMSPTFEADWLSPGTHVTCVSRRELGTGLLDRADVALQLGYNTIPKGANVADMEWRSGGWATYVAGREDERARIPPAGSAQHVAFPNLHDQMAGRVRGRTDDRQISLFVNTGTQGLQFAAVGGYTLEKAREAGLGHEFPTDWLLQDIRD
jgi:alanine dehydrogenase